MYFLMAMIVTFIYHMDRMCIVFMATDINYDFIIHGFAMCLIWWPCLHHTQAFLVFVNSLHNWLLFRESLLCAIPYGSCWIHTSLWSFQYFCLSPSKSLGFFYTSCWMMEDVLMPYFLLTSTHLIVGHISRIIVSTLGLAVISGNFPHY
jgi:hypothetical protein